MNFGSQTFSASCFDVTGCFAPLASAQCSGSSAAARATRASPMGAVAPSWSSSASVGALNLSIHLHALVLDAVFTNDDGAVRFHAVPPLTRDEVAQVVALIARRITRLLERRYQLPTNNHHPPPTTGHQPPTTILTDIYIT